MNRPKTSKAEIKREARALREALRQVEWYLRLNVSSEDFDPDSLQSWANDVAELGVSLDVMVAERTGLKPAPFMFVEEARRGN